MQKGANGLTKMGSSPPVSHAKSIDAHQPPKLLGGFRRSPSFASISVVVRAQTVVWRSLVAELSHRKKRRDCISPRWPTTPATIHQNPSRQSHPQRKGR